MKGWATPYIERLKRGERVQFRPRGNSMVPKIHSGDLVTVDPIADHQKLENGDIVLCEVKGKQFLHMIWSIGDGDGRWFEIGNNRGYSNGWTRADKIYGKLVKVEK